MLHICRYNLTNYFPSRNVGGPGVPPFDDRRENTQSQRVNASSSRGGKCSGEQSNTPIRCTTPPAPRDAECAGLRIRQISKIKAQTKNKVDGKRNKINTCLLVIEMNSDLVDLLNLTRGKKNDHKAL